jgi:hypothetical protein
LRLTQTLAQTARWPHCPRRPKPTTAGPPSPCDYHIFTGIGFPLWFAPSKLAASPSSLCQAGPGCQLRPSPAPPPLPVHPAPPSSALQVPSSRYHPAFIFPPLIPLLNPTPSSMASPPEFTAPLPASLRFSSCLSLPLNEHRRLRFYTTVARPPRRRPSSSEALTELPVLLSLLRPRR